MLDILKDKQMGKACKSRSATHTHTQAELLNNLSGVSRKLLGQTITVHINTHHVFSVESVTCHNTLFGSLMSLSHAADFGGTAV